MTNARYPPKSVIERNAATDIAIGHCMDFSVFSKTESEKRQEIKCNKTEISNTYCLFLNPAISLTFGIVMIRRLGGGQLEVDPTLLEARKSLAPEQTR